MKAIRKILRPVMLFLDKAVPVSSVKRSKGVQDEIDKRCRSEFELYEFEACPFCIKVRRFNRKHNLPIKTLDAKQDNHSKDLIQGGGKRQVPCLKISKGKQSEYLYESNDIIDYLTRELDLLKNS